MHSIQQPDEISWIRFPVNVYRSLKVNPKLGTQGVESPIDEGPYVRSNQGLKRKKTSKDVEPSKKAKSTKTSKGTTKLQPKSTAKSAQVEETVFEARDTQVPQNLVEDMLRVVESRAEVVEIVAYVVIGVGISVDCCRRGMNGEIGGGMVVAGVVEDSRITKTSEEGDDPDDVADIFKIEGTGTYEEYELNNHVIRDLKQLWLDNRVPYQLCEAYHFKNGVTEWPTCSLYIDGFCNDGELPRMVRVGSMIFFLRSQVRPHANFKTKTAHDPHLDINHIFDRNYDTSNAGNTHDKQGHEECVDDPTHEPSVCKIRRFEMMKYSFNVNEEYIAIKESEYLNHSKDNLDAYQELLRIIDEGWVVATPDDE
nr:hypothetical protein [Tanacetum cinerariifolium]